MAKANKKPESINFPFKINSNFASNSSLNNDLEVSNIIFDFKEDLIISLGSTI